MTKEYKKIQIRRDILSDFESLNPILASGEPAIAIDTNTFKIGDGINNWNALDSLSTQTFVEQVSGFLSTKIENDIANLVDGAPEMLNTLNELAAAINDDPNFASTFISSGTQFINDLSLTNINLNYISGIATYSSGQFPISLYDIDEVRGPLNVGEQNFYFPYALTLDSGSSLWLTSILNSNEIIYSTGASVERSITEAIRTVSGIALSSGDNISLLNNDEVYISSILEDISPQLGGNLDLNTNTIVGSGSILIYGSGNFSNNLYINNSPVIKSDITDISGNASGVYNTVIVDQTTFDNIPTKNPNTIYYII